MALIWEFISSYIFLNSIFEGFKANLNTLFFLIFNCCFFNNSFNKAFNDIKDLNLHLNKFGTGQSTTSKVYQILKEKLRVIYYEDLKKIY